MEVLHIQCFAGCEIGALRIDSIPPANPWGVVSPRQKKSTLAQIWMLWYSRWPFIYMIIYIHNYIYITSIILYIYLYKCVHLYFGPACLTLKAIPFDTQFINIRPQLLFFPRWEPSLGLCDLSCLSKVPGYWAAFPVVSVFCRRSKSTKQLETCVFFLFRLCLCLTVHCWWYHCWSPRHRDDNFVLTNFDHQVYNRSIPPEKLFRILSGDLSEPFFYWGTYKCWKNCTVSLQGLYISCATPKNLVSQWESCAWQRVGNLAVLVMSHCLVISSMFLFRSRTIS